ncbi:MAG: D-alanyl-D-alanine carboxypeptidase [Chloroflexi bacterium]|nr:D-alanyl-D-alanine carboxypeptidase [Chloroflexota bacterium]
MLTPWRASSARVWLMVVTTILATLLVLLPPSAAVAQAVPPREPAPSSRAAVVVDALTGAVLYGRAAFDELPPASLTKMVTALVAVERAPLDRPVRPTHNYDVVPVVIGIGLGDSLPLGDALYGLLLNSGNDVALAIAEAVAGGSVPRFVGWMNETAARLGLQHTHFETPHGLDHPGHVSSAYDMAIIGRALLEQPALAQIVAQKQKVVEGPPRWLFRATNPLLGVYAGADGIKTGYDDLAGRCLAATATRDGRRAIAVVLHSDNYAADAASLLDYAFADPAWGRPPSSLAAQPHDSVRIARLRADLADADGSAPPTLERGAQIEQAMLRRAATAR